MQLRLLLTLLYVSSMAMVTQTKRVLIIPTPFTSHTKYLTNVARALSKLGHEVWLTMPDYLVAKKVLDTSNFTVVEYQAFDHVEERLMEALRDKYFQGEREHLPTFFTVMRAHVDSFLTNETFFQQIQNIHPELIVIDNISGHTVVCIIPYRLGIPFAFLGTSYNPMTQRIPFYPAVTPIVLFAHTDHMTFVQRLQTGAFNLMSAMYDFHSYAGAVSRYAPEMPYIPTDMLVARAEIWLVEADHILDYAKPTVPNVKLIGGTAAEPAKPLSPPFSSFMDSATQGVVIISFGSYVLDLSKDISDKIFQVLMELPLKAVFRSNLTPPDPEKILTAAWIPQNDLLGHPNTKVFVSHSGKNGQYEALFHAIPVVATPLFGDQRYNAERMRSKGFGESVDIRTISADELRDTILKVAFTKCYKDSISKASELFKIEFGVPMERAAFWLDHVMKYGGGHMRFAGQDMPFYQCIGLDILLCCLGILSVCFASLAGCLYTFCKRAWCRQKRKVD